MATKPKAENTPRAARKPVPTLPAAWMREVNGVAEFVMHRPRLVEANGKRWFDSMAAYNRERLDVLAANVPPKMDKAAALKHLKGIKAQLD